MGNACTAMVHQAPERERQRAALVESEAALRQLREKQPNLGLGLPRLEAVRRLLRGAEQLCSSTGVEVSDAFAELGQ